MSNAGLPGKPPKNSDRSFDDIPMAEREYSIDAKPAARQLGGKTLGWALGISTIALVAGGLFAFQLSRSNSTPTAANPTASASPSASPTANTLLNHHKYAEAPASELEAIGSDPGFKLRSPAAVAYREMVNAASAQGVSLVPLSAFRSIAEQQQVYFDVKAERNQSAEQRATVSAPPGYSEHHTGYAIDIGDSTSPGTNLSQSFEGTAAFRWLQANAARFNFELSFPKDNQQGVMYEPWHWRFIGDQNSLETFYKAKEQQKRQQEEQQNQQPNSQQDSQAAPNASPNPSASSEPLPPPNPPN